MTARADAENPPSPGQSRGLSRRKKVAFAALATVCFFLLLEFLLAACGVKPVLYGEDPFVGFSSYAPLFVERTEGGRATMTTAENKLTWFNKQSFPREKPPGAYRVFCLGGSTTYGRPYDDTTSFVGWLRAFLPAADSSRRWEVVNAGGISYASYRVARVMEELLKYQPDLFVVYSGHNEFLERVTYKSLAETPRPVRAVQAALARTRTYALLRGAVGGSQTVRDDSAKQLLAPEVQAILDRSIGPESYRRDDRLRDQALAHYRIALNRMVDMARSAGAEVVFVAPASNLRDFSPFKSQFSDATNPDAAERVVSLLAQAETALAQGDAAAALVELDRALQLDDRFAASWFLRGRALLAAGEADKAREAFLRARDEDVCPLRALTPMGDILRRVAGRRDAPLVDFVAIVEKRSEYRIPGNDLFLDHVHPTIEGHRILAEALVQEFASRSILRLDHSWKPATVRRIAQTVEGALDDETHALALRNLSKVLGWAGKVDEAGELALRAVELCPDDAEALYQAGNAHFRRREFNRADERYQRSLELRPAWPKTYYGLGLVASERGQIEEAERYFAAAVDLDPDFAAAHFNLGNMLQAGGKLAAAVEHYRRAGALDPHNARAHHSLGVVLAKQGEFDRAERWFRKALEVDPGLLDAHADLALAFAKRGNFAEAVGWQSRAVQLAPSERRNQYRSALEYYQTQLARQR